MNLMNAKNLDFNKPLTIEDVTLYGHTEIHDSFIGTETVIGELCRIRYSNLGRNVRIDRNNFLCNVEMGDYSYNGPFDMIFNCRISGHYPLSYLAGFNYPQ